MHRPVYAFGEFRLDPTRRVLLRRNGDAVSVTPKAFEMLLYLVEHAGEVVLKETLLAALWPDTIVEESNLSQNIYTLRRVLGEERGEPRYIVTVPGRGYRFIAEVSAEDSGSDLPDEAPTEGRGGVEGGSAPAGGRSRLWWRLAVLVGIAAVLGVLAFVMANRTTENNPPGEVVRSLAILPFKPLVAETRDESLEMGMADSMIMKLSSIRQISVQPLSAVRSYGGEEHDLYEAGRALGVDAVVDGYIQRWGDRVRVTARLVRIADRKQLWAGHFDEQFTDIFTVQDSISGRVAGALAIELTGDQRALLSKRHTSSSEAYDLYLKGRFFWGKRTREGAIRAIEYYQEALERDDRYALAYAGLADAYRALAIRSDIPSEEPFRQAKEAAVRALEIDDGLGEAHTALGWILFFHDWNWEEAEREFRRALEINPDDSLARLGYAHVLLVLGRHDDAVLEAERGVTAEPLSPHAGTIRGMILFYAGRGTEALEQLHDTLEIDPAYWIAHIVEGQVHLAENRLPDAMEAYQRARDYAGGIAQATALIGYTHAVSGRRAEAEGVLRELEATAQQEYVSPYHLALVNLGLGNSERAIQLLHEAGEERDVHMVFLNVDPKWAPLRAHPDFVALSDLMNLPARTQAISSEDLAE